jgi:hypothetical protein
MAATIELHPPERRKVGTWREMNYDAVAIVHGLVWRRAEGGFGDRDANHEREDWVLDLPHVNTHVVRERVGAGSWSKWGTSVFFLTYGSIEDAMYAALDEDLDGMEEKFRETAAKLGGLAVAIHDMKAALKVGVPNG